MDKEGPFFSCVADVEGLEPAECPLSAPAQNLSSVSDRDKEEMVLPDSTSPGSDDTVTQSERYSSYPPFRLSLMVCATLW